MDTAGTSGRRTKAWLAGGAATIACAAVVAQLVPSLTGPSSPDAPDARPAPSAPAIELVPARAKTYSNIYRYDYVGPDACGACHADNFEKWQRHPHSRMNRNATESAVVGDFAEARIDYGDGHATFSKARGEYLMTVFTGDEAVRQFRVTRVVGSRYIQMYVGKQTQGPEPPDDPVYTDEVKLPFAYWIDRKEWFPQTYDENVEGVEYGEDHALTARYQYAGKATGAWQRVCIKCHNTYPYALRFDPAAKGATLGFTTSEVSMTSLPLELPPAGDRLAAIETSSLVTMGISCESCHLGGREHAEKGSTISFAPSGEGLERSFESVGTGQTPHVVNSICRQCHAAEPQGPLYADGSASWNAREAADLMGGACKTKISCVDCHDPHQAGPTRADAPDDPAHVKACLGCHAPLREAGAALAHSKHAAGSATCLDCHMPRIVHGLAGFTRSHRISSPTDPRMLATDQPNACNLCHLDKSLKWTIDALDSKWGKRPDVGAEVAASDAPLGPIWLRQDRPVVRHVAGAAYGRAALEPAEALTRLLPLLDDSSPPVRMFSVLAVEKVLGRRVGTDEYTPWATPAIRRKQIEALGNAAPPSPR